MCLDVMVEDSRLTLNVVLLLLLVLHGNAAFKEYTAVTELSPGRLFHLLVVPAGRSRGTNFAPSMKILEQFFWDTAVHNKILTYTVSAKRRH